MVKGQDIGQQGHLLAERGIGIDLIKGILLQVVFADHLGRIHGQAVFFRQGIQTNQAHNLLQFTFFLQQVHSAGHFFRPADLLMLVDVLAHLILVKRVRTQPVDGWEVAPLGQLSIQAPEDLNNPQGILRYRL